ncbi:MAG TPA: hypothetical protein VIX86_06995 [Streptosporangiaceae bacterium]
MTYLAAGSASTLGNVVSGTLGFLIVAGMGLALFFLLRSMNKQLRKVAPGPSWREKGPDAKPSTPTDIMPNGPGGV